MVACPGKCVLEWRKHEARIGNVNGSIADSALHFVHSGTEVSPYQVKHKTTAARKSTKTTDTTESAHEDETTPPSAHSRRQAPVTPLQTPSVVSNRKKNVRIPARNRRWHLSWATCIQLHANSGWAAGVTNILEHMFSHESVDNIVRLTDDLYHNKDTIAINKATKTSRDLARNREPAQIVAVKFKVLWSAMESVAMARCKALFAYLDLALSPLALETQLDQIGKVPDDELGDVARRYLGGRQKRSRDALVTRATFLARHLLDVLGYKTATGHSEAEVKEKTRLLKAQKMIAKNIAAFVGVSGEGALLLTRKYVWQSTLDQVSDKTIKPLLEELVRREPKLRKIAELAGKVVKYAKNSSSNMTKTVMRAQDIQRGRKEHGSVNSASECLCPASQATQVTSH